MKLNATRNSVLATKKKVPADTTTALDSDHHEFTSAASHSKCAGSFFILTYQYRPLLPAATPTRMRPNAESPTVIRKGTQQKVTNRMGQIK